jgi:formylmethanofuran dehydrogenase subunit E
MPLKGEAKTLYQREYMRRYRAGLPAPAKPARCSFCGEVASEAKPLVEGNHVRICGACAAAATELIAAEG